MNPFASGKGYKSAAEAALAKASSIEDAQRDIEFGRNLLANIRQERIARAQLELGNTSADYTTSSAAGAIANIDSSLAGEMRFSYESSHRAQRITDLQDEAKRNMQKYAKQQQRRATAFAITGAVVGAAAGGALGAAGLVAGGSAAGGALAGAQIGQGFGQIAANTGMQNSFQGVQNIIGGFTQGNTFSKIGEIGKAFTSVDKTIYQTASINPTTNQEIANSQRLFYYSPTVGKAVPLIGGIFS